MKPHRRKTALSLALGGLLGALSSSGGQLGQLQYVGVNLFGAEFGETVLPGVYNTHYRYPSQEEVDYFQGKGMNVIRLPFRWERLQQAIGCSLNRDERERMDSFVNETTAKGMTVILDPHNFARYYPDPNNFQQSQKGLIGTDPGVPYSVFGDFWARVAERYKYNPRVIFGLMNEPNTMATEDWLTAANTAIAAIRGTGATNLVLVPGNGYGGAFSWQSNWYGTPNGVALLNIVDSAGNFAYEAHQYLDGNSSGTSTNIVSPTIGADRLNVFTQWLKTNNKKGFLGEFAVADVTIGNGIGQIGDEAIMNMITHMENNSDVYLGWAWWAAGPWFTEYMFSLEPADLGLPTQTDRIQMSVLEMFLPAPP